MNFEDEEEWDLDLVVKLVQSEEQAIAARRAVSATPVHCSPLLAHPPALSNCAIPLPLPKQDNFQSPAFDLQQRLLQAERELSDLRRKSQQNTANATSSVCEELKRLQAEVLFKDQEILEAKRACTEKSEHLKRILNENEELKKQFEETKRTKWQGSLDLQTRENNEGRVADRTSDVGHTDICDSQGRSDQGPWYAPWTATIALCDRPNLKSVSRQDDQVQLKITSRELSDRDLETRISNGCISTSKGEVNNCKKQLQIATSFGDACGKGQIIGPTSNSNSWDRLFRNNLLNIWCPGNMKEEGKELVAKLLGVCEADMHILLSMDNGGTNGSKHPTDSGSSLEAFSSRSKNSSNNTVESKEGRSTASKTNIISSLLVKVANGLVSSWSLFLTLLELSELENAEIAESALRVLHRLLIQDEVCRNNLFERKHLPKQPEKVLFRAAGHQVLLKENLSKPSEGLYGDSSSMSVLERYFFCPRISWDSKVFPQCQHNGQGKPLQENVGSEIIKEKFGGKYREWAQSGSDIMRRIFRRALDKARKSCDEAIGATAASILVTIVTNTEPFSTREIFGFILFDGSLASLLRMSANLEVQLQSVRLFHSLLHCPTVLRKLLDFQEQSSQELDAPCPNQSSKLVQEVEQDGRSAEENVFWQNNEDVGQLETTGAVSSTDQHHSFEVLEGLIYCISQAGLSSQACSLRRNSLRVLTFIATAEERGAAFLLAKEMVLVKELSLKMAGAGIGKDGSSAVMPLGSLPVHLIAILDRELRTEEDACNTVTMEQTEEREYVIRETLTLLCRLASHATHSSRTIAGLTCHRNIARLSLSVINRLMSRDSCSESLHKEERSMPSSVNVIELCKGLRRRILASVSTV